MSVRAYNREAALAYAAQWWGGRNPQYFAFDKLGGDCTNFVSQCIYAGSSIMNYTPTFGWYYKNGNAKAPAWTGVPYLFNFLTRQDKSVGPFGHKADWVDMEVGDVIQLSFGGKEWRHTLLVVGVGADGTPMVAAHDDNAWMRRLDEYDFQICRMIHIDGVRV